MSCLKIIEFQSEASCLILELSNSLIILQVSAVRICKYTDRYMGLHTLYHIIHDAPFLLFSNLTEKPNLGLTTTH